jgi:hypothetical protein
MSHKSKSHYDWLVSLGSHFWAPWQDFCCCQTVAVLSMWSTLSDKRLSLSYTTCLSTKLLMVFISTVSFGSESPQDSWPNFTDGSRNLQTTATLSFVTSQSHVMTKDQSVLVSNPIWGPRPDLCYSQKVMDLSMWGRPLQWEERSGINHSHSQ